MRAFIFWVVDSLSYWYNDLLCTTFHTKSTFCVNVLAQNGVRAHNCAVCTLDGTAHHAVGVAARGARRHYSMQAAHP